MKLLMCLSCGHFVTATVDGDGGGLVPIADECPECGGTEFENHETGDRVRVAR